MKQQVRSGAVMLALIAGSLTVQAQTGNVGIGTVIPGSKLTVNGSFAGMYKTGTATALDATDFYYAWNGTTAGTIALPTAMAVGGGNYQGRVYHIKNTGTATLTVAAAGSELLDNQSGAEVASIALPAGYYAMIVSKGTTTGATWEVAIVGNSSTSTPMGADNGLTTGYLTPGNIGLGGTLGKNTDVALNSRNLTFSGAGNVGIGTSTPGYESGNFTAGVTTGNLDVAGNIRAKGGLITFQGNNAAPINNPIAAVYNQANVGTTMTGYNIDFQTSASGAPTSRMRVLPGGNVGVGTTSPGNKLEVNSGNSGASGLRFTQMNSSTAPAAAALLGVNANGDVVVTNGGFSKQYLSASRQYSAQSLTAGTDIIPNTINGNTNGIPYNTSTGVATLTAGKTYLITASLHVVQSSSTTFQYMQYGLVNAANNTLLVPGLMAELLPANYSNAVASSGTLTVIFTATASINTIKLRTINCFDNYGNGNAVVNLRSDLFSGFTIIEL